jgi:hypothetical protein
VLSDWWNGVELWVLGLPFPLQFALVVVVIGPLCLVVAWLIDRIVDHASALLGPAHATEETLGSKHDEDVETEAETDAATDTATDTEADTEAQTDTETDAAAERVPAESAGR